MSEQYPDDYLERDEYGLVINGAETYQALGNTLFYDRSVIFPWTDEAGTRLDVLMALVAKQLGELEGGMNTGTDLFIAIREGMFGFDITNGHQKSADYVGEKLNLGGTNETTKKLAQLINGVAGELLPLAGY